MSVKVVGLDEVKVKLKSLTPPQVNRKIGMITFAVGKELEQIMRPYPPKPPHSTYRRTKKLGRTWYTKKSGQTATVGNPTPYARWVQSKDSQTWFHKEAGWKTDEQGVIELEKSNAIRRIAVGILLKG